MQISEKYKQLLLSNSDIDMLEGTTFAGKTTVGFGLKFVIEMRKTKLNKHLIAGDSIGTVESNIINSDNGLLDIWGDEIKYFPNGTGSIRLPHLKAGKDIIYVVGYSDTAKFKKVLGGQFGAVGIDEINIANMTFVNEIMLPRYEYLIGTLNPDNPDLDVYNKLVNRCRPIQKEIPIYMQEELDKSKPMNNWRYWFFTYDDNPSLTKERREALLSSLLPGTKEFKTKIEGRRTKGTGLIFRLQDKNIIKEEIAKSYKYKIFSMGVDTSYSSNSVDTFSLIFTGITECGKCIILEEKVLTNKDRLEKDLISPSELAKIITNFANECNLKWCSNKVNLVNIFIDNADQATITECIKYKRMFNTIYNYVSCWKETKILDRILLQNGWLASEDYLIVEHCEEHIKEHGKYCRNEKGEIEDKNDHTINGSQYSWLPFKKMIGVRK